MPEIILPYEQPPNIITNAPFNFSIDFPASSEFIVNIRNRISSLIQLAAIILAPGEQIIIDTDLQTVLIDGTHDISGLTTGSELFQLHPGLNTITFYPVFSGPVSPEVENTVPPLNVKLIWQERWL